MFVHIAYFMILPLRRPWSNSVSGIHSPDKGGITTTFVNKYPLLIKYGSVISVDPAVSDLLAAITSPTQ